MLPTPSSSPRVILENRTNVLRPSTNRKPSFVLPTPPRDKRHAATDVAEGPKKRFKLSQEEDEQYSSESDDGKVESDVEMEDLAVVQAKARTNASFRLKTRVAMRYPAHHRTADSACVVFQS